MHHIKGQQRNQFQIFCLEQEVAKDSFVRLIDLFAYAITPIITANANNWPSIPVHAETTMGL